MGSPSNKYNVLFQQKCDTLTQEALGHSGYYTSMYRHI